MQSNNYHALIAASPTQRLETMAQLTRTARRLSLLGQRARHPNLQGDPWGRQHRPTLDWTNIIGILKSSAVGIPYLLKWAKTLNVEPLLEKVSLLTADSIDSLQNVKWNQA